MIWLYFEETAIWYTNPSIKAEIYDDAAKAKLEEAGLWSAETEREKNFEVLAQAISYFEKAEALCTDKDLKAFVHINRGYKLANLGEKKGASAHFQKCIDFWGDKKMIGLLSGTLKIVEEVLRATNADAHYINWVINQNKYLYQANILTLIRASLSS